MYPSGCIPLAPSYISEKAQTSLKYMNHCIKATTGTVLKKEGIAPKNIMAVTGHKNVASLDSYLAEPDTNETLAMSNILSNFGKNITPTINPSTAVASSHPISAVVSNSQTYSSEIVQKQINLENTAATLLAGAQFHGPVTINFNITK